MHELATRGAVVVWDPCACGGDNSRVATLVREAGAAPAGSDTLTLQTEAAGFDLQVDLQRGAKPFANNDFCESTTLLLGLRAVLLMLPRHRVTVGALRVADGALQAAAGAPGRPRGRAVVAPEALGSDVMRPALDRSATDPASGPLTCPAPTSGGVLELVDLDVGGGPDQAGSGEGCEVRGLVSGWAGPGGAQGAGPGDLAVGVGLDVPVAVGLGAVAALAQGSEVAQPAREIPQRQVPPSSELGKRQRGGLHAARRLMAPTTSRGKSMSSSRGSPPGVSLLVDRLLSAGRPQPLPIRPNPPQRLRTVDPG